MKTTVKKSSAVPQLKKISGKNALKNSEAALIGKPSSGKKKKEEEKPKPRIELQNMTLLELDGIAWLKEYAKEKTSSGAIKYMLKTVQNLVKERDDYKSQLIKLQRTMVNVKQSFENVESAKIALAECVAEMKVKEVHFDDYSSDDDDDDMPWEDDE